MEAELKTFLEAHGEEREAEGAARSCNGYQPLREVLTGGAPIKVQTPKTRDRAGEGRCFRSEAAATVLEEDEAARGDDLDETLMALFNDSVEGLSPATISRPKRGW